MIEQPSYLAAFSRILATPPLALMNQPAFYEAFDIKPGDRMYLAPEKRVSIW